MKKNNHSPLMRMQIDFHLQQMVKSDVQQRIFKIYSIIISYL